MTKKNVNGEIMEMSTEEQTAHDNDIAQNAVELQERQEAEQTKENLKASAKQKLINGEPLTEEEADTIVL